MMAEWKLEIGDHVHYGAHGVCLVKNRETKDLGSMKRDYFVMQPAGKDNILLYLPVDADPEKVKFRRLLSRQEILDLIHNAEDPSEWISDSKLRREAWNKMLHSGDMAQLIRMVRLLYAHQQELPAGKQLPMSDQEIMRAAERQIYSEFSYVLELQEDQVLPFILQEAGENP